MNDTPQPALNITVIAGIIGAAALLVIARANRSIDLFNAAELDQAKALITLAGPVIAGVLIRRRVTPNSKVEERASTVEAMVYAKALEDTPPPAAPPRARPVRKAAAKSPPAKR